MSDKEDVIQALVVLQLTKGHFWIGNCRRDLLVLVQELVFKKLKLFEEQICVILTNN